MVLGGVALVTLSAVIDSVCLVGTSYVVFPLGEAFPFQLQLHLLQNLQLLWANVPGFEVAGVLAHGGALQHGVSQVLPLGINVLDASSHSSPRGLFHG